MIAIKAHFDGKVLVPDEPLELPKDTPLIVEIKTADFPQTTRTPGLSRGSVMWISDDFDDPLPDEFWLGKE